MHSPNNIHSPHMSTLGPMLAHYSYGVAPAGWRTPPAARLTGPCKCAARSKGSKSMLSKIRKPRGLPDKAAESDPTRSMKRRNHSAAQLGGGT